MTDRILRRLDLDGPQAVRWIVIAFLAGGLWGILAGCGALVYPETPENRIDASRGLFGGAVSLRNAADTNVELEDCEFNPETRMLRIGRAKFESAQSANQRELMQWIREYERVRATEWAGFNQFAGTVASVAGSTLQTYLTGRAVNQGLKTLRPNLIEDFALLSVAGKLDNPTEILEKLERDFPGIKTEIDARLATIIANAGRTTTRPE